MALPTSGPLSLSQIAAEFNIAPPYSMSKMYGKAAGIPVSGPISISQFYGKTNIFYVNITASVVRPNLRTLAINSGWDGQSPVVVNITAPLLNGLDVGTVPFPAGITVNISAGTRIGTAAGMDYYEIIAGRPQFYSRDVIYTRVPVTINNLGIISSGGGGSTYGLGPGVKYNNGDWIMSQGGRPGQSQGFVNNGSLTVQNASNGEAGTYAKYTGAVLGGQQQPWAQGGKGGDGVAWGAFGNRGAGGQWGGSYSDYTDGGPSDPQGYPGRVVDGISFVTWQNQGTLLGLAGRN